MDGRTDFTFTVPRGEYNRAMDVLNTSVKAHIGSGVAKLDVPGEVPERRLRRQGDQLRGRH